MAASFSGMTWRHIFQRGIILSLDGLVEIALVALTVFGDDGLSLGIRQVLDALLTYEVELDPDALALRVDHAESVAPKAVHVAVGSGNAALAHRDGDLMEGLRQIGPEVPVVLSAAKVRTRVSLHGVVEVGELKGIAQEEDGRVVAHEVPVTFLRVELDSEASDIALRIGCASFASHGREPDEQVRLLANLGEDLRLGILGDILRHRERAEGP